MEHNIKYLSPTSRTVCWFSCGATSAVAASLALKKFPDAEVVYCDTGSEHPDNHRFLKDCEKWLGKTITILKSAKYANVDEVIEQTRYLVGPTGARCTTELKKKQRMSYQLPDDLQIFGFDATENKRATEFIGRNRELCLWFPLLERELTKQDCLTIIRDSGIELPITYNLGFRNANCLGCVKGGAGYWNKIRIHFPEVFHRRAKQERMLGIAILRKNGNPLFLDELPADMGNYEFEPSWECGLSCGLFLSDLDNR